MKHTDPLDESREHWVDGQIDAANKYGGPLEGLTDGDIDIICATLRHQAQHQRHMEEKGRLLKERCAREMEKEKLRSPKQPESTL